jgi:hypothetical protein
VTPVVKDAADEFKRLRDLLGGNKRMVELLGIVFATIKIAEFTSKVGLLKTRLTELKKVGPIAIVIALELVPRSSKGQKALDAAGIGFLGHIPVIGSLRRRRRRSATRLVLRSARTASRRPRRRVAADRRHSRTRRRSARRS